MKNIEVLNLRKEVQKEVRLQVYKDTLAFIKSRYKYRGYGNSDKVEFEDGLCILLPAILWGLKAYLDKAPSGEYWCYSDTKTAFPELTNEVLSEIRNSRNRVKTRQKFLEDSIKELSV